jgi:hypothetical protein
VLKAMPNKLRTPMLRITASGPLCVGFGAMLAANARHGTKDGLANASDPTSSAASVYDQGTLSHVMRLIISPCRRP